MLLSEDELKGKTASFLFVSASEKRNFSSSVLLRQRLHERGLICSRIGFWCGYSFCLHYTDWDCYWNRVDLKTLPKVEIFQKVKVSSVMWSSKPYRFEYGYYFGAKICIVRFKMVNLAGNAVLSCNITWIFWRKTFRGNTSEPHRFWRSFQVVKLCQYESAFV